MKPYKGSSILQAGNSGSPSMYSVPPNDSSPGAIWFHFSTSRTTVGGSAIPSHNEFENATDTSQKAQTFLTQFSFHLIYLYNQSETFISYFPIPNWLDLIFVCPGKTLEPQSRIEEKMEKEKNIKFCWTIQFILVAYFRWILYYLNCKKNCLSSKLFFRGCNNTKQISNSITTENLVWSVLCVQQYGINQRAFKGKTLRNLSSTQHLAATALCAHSQNY